MKKHILIQLIVCSISTIFIFSQKINAQEILLPLNKETSAYYESYLYQDYLKSHTAIRTFYLNKNNIDSINRIITGETRTKIFSQNLFQNKENNNYFFSINPIFSLAPAYSTKNGGKNYFYSNLGVRLVYAYKAKLNITISAYGVYETVPEDTTFFSVPHFGENQSSKKSECEYFPVTGTISYRPSQYFQLIAGNDKNFYGDGYRSLLLSDNAAPYPFFRIIAGKGRLKYSWIISALNDVDTILGDLKFNRKYIASHFLSFNVGKRLNFTVFETIIGNRRDSLKTNRGVDINYLNPIAFYRPLEFTMGSPNNALLGLGFRYRLFANTHLYGQAILDEFKLNQMKTKGNWSNKYGFQLGVKCFDILPGLFFQGEVNWVRPFTYSHEFTEQCYGNKYQPMAHPLGANFMEGIGIIRYIRGRFLVSFTGIYSNYGLDNNYIVSRGQDIYKSYELRDKTVQNTTKVAQGSEVKQINAQLYGQWLLNPYFFSVLFFKFNAEKYSGNLSTRENKTTVSLQIGIKTNLY